VIFASSAHALELGTTHQASDSLAPDEDFVGSKLGVNSPNAVRTA